MNVLVYTGPDTSSPSLSHTLTSLRTLLTPNYAVQTLDAKALPTQPWPASCALLIIPPFQSQSGAGAFSAAAAKDVQNYVRGGGKLLSLGNAVRVDPSKIPTALALSAQVAGVSISDVSPTPASAPRPKLTLEDGDVGLAFSLAPVTEGIVDAPAIRLVDGAQLDGVQSAGGVDLPTLPEAALSAKGVEFLAQYDPTEDSCVVAIKARIGRGVAAFWGAHLEAPLASDPARDKARLQALRRTLDLLGLRLPSPSAAGESDNGAVARPTPQILSSAPWRIGVVETILRALEVPELAAAAPYEFKDSNDTFLFHPQQEAARVFAEQREATKTLGEDPATWNPKHIVVYKDGMTAPQELTPKFRIETYYEELRNARGERGCPENYPDGAWGVGEALLYGEVVTSTQTMLDKNIRLLTSLPTPLLSLASAQLTGRGRGGNVWLSPPGCLQFSLLLRAPLSALPATKIVFVQYLFALAVAEACRTDGVLGEEAGSRVRIKWPNDLYAITPDGERKKIGGILVNTSFGAGKVELVVGCGLNVLNPPPITSLAQLLPDAGSGGPPPPTMERTLAAITARFERMWAEFVRERGSFEPFMDLYLERWLHSDQQVTLTTVAPPRKVRIVGITPEHGLLRTLPERDAWSAAGQGAEHVDLQPDGNSFDLMAGLIRTKT